MSGWEGDNTPRLIELVGGDINEDLESLKTRTIEAYKYRFDKFICDRDVVLDFGSGLGFGSEAFAVSELWAFGMPVLVFAAAEGEKFSNCPIAPDCSRNKPRFALFCAWAVFASAIK